MESIDLTDTQLYETFREMLGKDKAEKTVNAVKNITRSEVEGQTKVLATREQLAAVELHTSKQLAAVELSLNNRIHKAQIQTIIWIVSVGLLQLVASYLLKG